MGNSPLNKGGSVKDAGVVVTGLGGPDNLLLNPPEVPPCPRGDAVFVER